MAIEKRGATLRARSTNRSTAAESIPAPTSSEGTGHNCSSATPRSFAAGGQDPHGRRVRRGWPRSDRPAASRTCSQLSNTNSRDRPSNAAATLSLTLLPGCWVMPSTAATASGTAAGSADRRQFEQPHAVREVVAEPRRDLQRQAGLADPADAGQRHQPMRLERRLQTSATSDSRPMKLVVGGRRFPGRRIKRPQTAETRCAGRRARTWNTVDRFGDVAQPPRPQIESDQSR